MVFWTVFLTVLNLHTRLLPNEAPGPKCTEDVNSSCWSEESLNQASGCWRRLCPSLCLIEVFFKNSCMVGNSLSNRFLRCAAAWFHRKPVSSLRYHHWRRGEDEWTKPTNQPNKTNIQKTPPQQQQQLRAKIGNLYLVGLTKQGKWKCTGSFSKVLQTPTEGRILRATCTLKSLSVLGLGGAFCLSTWLLHACPFGAGHFPVDLLFK